MQEGGKRSASKRAQHLGETVVELETWARRTHLDRVLTLAGELVVSLNTLPTVDWQTDGPLYNQLERFDDLYHSATGLDGCGARSWMEIIPESIFTGHLIKQRWQMVQWSAISSKLLRTLNPVDWVRWAI